MNTRDVCRNAIALAVLVSIAAGGCRSGGAPGDADLPPIETTPVLAGPDDWQKVQLVVDGDTLLIDSRTVRLIGINAPERGQPHFLASKACLEALIGQEPIRLEHDVQRRDMYDRELAYVYSGGGALLNVEVVRAGYAHAYTLPPNVAHVDELRTAEAEARAAEKGLWEHSSMPLAIADLVADAAGPDEGNLNGESVTIENLGSTTVDLTGLTLADVSNNTYIYPSHLLPAGGRIVLYTGVGHDGPTSLYWGRSSPVWNNSGDVAFLRDPEGRLIDMFSYGAR